jgi:hypothetical protein
LIFAAVTLLAGGIVLGWWAHGRWRSGDTTVVVERPVQILRERAVATGTMPDVVGLTRAAALQALGDAGADLSRVSIAERAYAGDPGVVISQAPDPTSALSAAPKITLSAPGTMPQIVGVPVDRARTTLSALGASVVVEMRYEAGASENTVLDVSPAPGHPLTAHARIAAAEPASSVFLDQLSAIDSSCSSDTAYVGGVERARALVCTPGEGAPAAMEYVLNREVTRFEAVVGIADRSASDTPVTFRVLVDGRSRFLATLPFGTAKRVSVPVAGALRVRIEAAVAKQGPSGREAEAVIASARFVGGRTAIDRLTAESHS